MNLKSQELMVTLEAGKIAARYNMLILLVFPALAILKLAGLMSFGWTIFAVGTGIAFLAVIGSVSAVGSKPIFMIVLSTIISACTILLVHRDGLLILIFPILIAMLYSDVGAIRLSFVFSVSAYVLVEGTSYYFLKEFPSPGVVASGVIMMIQLFLLLGLGQTLIDRMRKKLESERVFMESISELLANAKDLADDIEVDEKTKEGSPAKNIIDKVKNETAKILKYNKAIAEINKGAEEEDTVMEDITLLLALSEKLHKTLEDLGEDLGNLTGAIGSIGEIIEDAKEMAATAAVEEVAMREKAPEVSKMAEGVGLLAHGAKDAAERLVEALREIGKDGEKAVATVDKAYESVYTNLELINRNVEMLLRWFVMKRGSM